MAITESFDPQTPALILASEITRPLDGFPATMVVTFQPKTFAVLLEEYETRPLAQLSLEEAVEGAPPLWPGQACDLDYGGRRLAACLSPIGAPGAVGLFELALAQGVKQFVVFGTCGGLSADLVAGGIIVPTEAYRDEGTSYHYAPASDYITVATASRTATILSELGIPHTAGRVWTTDAFFRETQANLARRIEDGCIAVDMEVSALAAFAQFRGVAVHHFLYTADSLTEAEWDARTLGNLPAEPRARYVKIALELASRL
jgi:uridine phosphorylase